MCTKRDLYEMKFPPGATSAQKCTLLGCAPLIARTVKEQAGPCSPRTRHFLAPV